MMRRRRASRYYTEAWTYPSTRTRSELDCKAAGITIPFPQRDLHVRSGVGGPVGGPAEPVEAIDSFE